MQPLTEKPYLFESVLFEITNRCNLSCPFCAQTKMKRPRGVMPLETAKSLIDEIYNKKISDSIIFHYLGEPLLHPQLEKIISYCAGKIENTSLYTNGVLLDEDKLRGILNAGLAKLDISMQGSGADYSKRVESAIRYKVLKNLPPGGLNIRHLMFKRKVKRKRKALGRDMGIFVFNNREEMHPIIERYKQYISRYATAKPKPSEERFNIHSGQNVLNIGLYPGINFRVITINTWGNSINDTPPVRGMFGRCKDVAERRTLGISWDKRICFCCSDFDFDTSVGQITDGETMMDVVNGEKAKRFIKEMNMGILKNPRCRRCFGSYNSLNLVVQNIYSMYKPFDVVFEAC